MQTFGEIQMCRRPAEVGGARLLNGVTNEATPRSYSHKNAKSQHPPWLSFTFEVTPLNQPGVEQCAERTSRHGGGEKKVPDTFLAGRGLDQHGGAVIFREAVNLLSLAHFANEEGSR